MIILPNRIEALNWLGASTLHISLMTTVSALPYTLFTLPAGAIADLVRILLITLALVFSGGTAPGQQASGSPAKPTPAPTPIPLARVPLEAQSALTSLQEIDANVSRDRSSADGIARTLSELTSEIDARIADDTRLLTTSPSLDVLYRLKLAWEDFGVRLLVTARELSAHATSLEEQLARLDQLNKTWQATLQSAKLPEAPPLVLQSVQSVVGSIERTQQAAESGRDHVLTLQSRLSEEEARVAGAFTVGVGFGLQTVINNFVCGLILLFERPIKVGDVVQVDTDIGEVRRIGIRACVKCRPCN